MSSQNEFDVPSDPDELLGSAAFNTPPPDYHHQPEFSPDSNLRQDEDEESDSDRTVMPDEEEEEEDLTIMADMQLAKRARMDDSPIDEPDIAAAPAIQREDVQSALNLNRTSDYFKQLEKLEAAIEREIRKVPPSAEEITQAIADGNLALATQWVVDGFDLAVRDSDYKYISTPLGFQVALLISRRPTLPFREGELDIALMLIEHVSSDKKLRELLKELEEVYGYPLSFDAVDALFTRNKEMFREFSRFGRGPLLFTTVLKCTEHTKFWEHLYDHFMKMPNEALYGVLQGIRQGLSPHPMSSAFVNYLFVTRRYPIDIDDMIYAGGYLGEVAFLFDRFNLIPSKRGLEVMKMERQFEEYVELIQYYVKDNETSTLVPEQRREPIVSITEFLA